MAFWKRKNVVESRDNEIIAMSTVIADLKSENEKLNERIKDLKDTNYNLRQQLKGEGIPYNPYPSPFAQRLISYKMEIQDGYLEIIADQEADFTISFNREFDKSKSNYNWINKGDALISLKYDNRGSLFGDTTLIKSPESGIFESVRNKLASKGDVLCRIKLIPENLKKQTLEDLERNEIKENVLKRERKKMIERETLDELIAEGRVFNVITVKNGNRMAIPSDIASAVWNRDGGRCCNCGSREELEFDHIIPISKGGATTFRNLQLLCKTCNVKKSDKI